VTPFLPALVAGRLTLVAQFASPASITACCSCGALWALNCSLRIEVLLVEQPFEPGRVQLCTSAVLQHQTTWVAADPDEQRARAAVSCANPASTQAVYLEFASALVPAAARLPSFSVLQLTLNFINKLVELLSAVCRLARAVVFLSFGGSRFFLGLQTLVLGIPIGSLLDSISLL